MMAVTARRPYASRQRKSNQSLEKSTPKQKKNNPQLPFLADGCKICNWNQRRQQRIKTLSKTLGSIHTHMASLACFWFTTVLRDLDSLLCSAGWLKSSEVSYIKILLNPPVRTNPPPQPVRGRWGVSQTGDVSNNPRHPTGSMPLS